MQDATENCRFPEIVGELLRLELYFVFPVEHVSELIVLGERMPLVAVDKFGVVGKISKMDNVSAPANIQPYSTTKVSVPLFLFHWLCSNSW